MVEIEPDPSTLGTRGKYAQLKNKKVQPIRAACQDRVVGQMEQATAYNCRESWAYLEALHPYLPDGDSKETCDWYVTVLKWLEQNPDVLHDTVDKFYADEYSESRNAGGGETAATLCPYEQSNDKTHCWSCHVPRRVWEELERRYRHEQAKKEVEAEQ